MTVSESSMTFGTLLKEVSTSIADARERLQKAALAASVKDLKYVICIDYMPLSVWINNMEYFCVLVGHKNEHGSNTYEVLFANKYRYSKPQCGVIRKRLYYYNRLSTAVELLESVIQSNSLNNQQALRECVKSLAGLKLSKLNFQFKGTIINDNSDGEIRLFSDSDEKYIDAIQASIEAITSLIARTSHAEYIICSNDIEPVYFALSTAVEKFFSHDSIDDLLQYIKILHYAQCSNDCDITIQDITNISEVNSLNIVTNFYQAIKLTEKQASDYTSLTPYQQYMFVANYELLHLFSCGFASYSNPRNETLRSYAILKEFVPIAMQFKNIYNPLFDMRFNNRELLLEFSDDMLLLKNAEVCRNVCNFLGNSVGHLSDESLIQSKTFFGLCGDVHAIFSSKKIVISPSLEHGRFVFSTDLCAALFYIYLASQSAIGTFDYSDVNSRKSIRNNAAQAARSSKAINISFVPRWSSSMTISNLQVDWSFVYLWFLRATASCIRCLTPSATPISYEEIAKSWLKFFPTTNDCDFSELMTNLNESGILLDYKSDITEG